MQKIYLGQVCEVDLSPRAKEIMVALLSGRRDKSSETIRRKIGLEFSKRQVAETLQDLHDRGLVIRTEVRSEVRVNSPETSCKRYKYRYVYRAARGIGCLEIPD